MKVLSELCLRNVMSQDELAKKIGVSQPFISDLVNGKKFPSLKTAQKIASVFGVTVSYLLGETGGNHAKNQANSAAKKHKTSRSGTAG